MVAINDSAGVRVKAVLDRWEAAWNASDMTAMWQLATDDDIGSTSLGCIGAEKQKYRRRIKRTSICCLRTDRANSMRLKALSHCPAALSSRSSAGRWAAFDGQLGK